MVGLEKEAPCWEPKGEMFVFFLSLAAYSIVFLCNVKVLTG